MSEFSADRIFKVKFPFVTTSWTEMTADGPEPHASWKPGTEFVEDGPEGEGNLHCHAEGWMVLTVIDTFKPGRFPERVFYTRQWIDPDMRVFGATKLHMATVEKFRRISRRYLHDYVNDGEDAA